jgi:enoyl-CoA hydratase / long-chain 3-hydroxyacyl-CoA dehydrogenase
MSTSPMLSNRVHTKYEVRNGVAIVKLDSPNSKVNTLNTEVMTEMKELFEILEKDPNVKASVLISGEWLDQLLFVRAF